MKEDNVDIVKSGSDEAFDNELMKPKAVLDEGTSYVDESEYWEESSDWILWKTSFWLVRTVMTRLEDTLTVTMTAIETVLREDFSELSFPFVRKSPRREGLVHETASCAPSMATCHGLGASVLRYSTQRVNHPIPPFLESRRAVFQHLDRFYQVAGTCPYLGKTATKSGPRQVSVRGRGGPFKRRSIHHRG